MLNIENGTRRRRRSAHTAAEQSVLAAIDTEFTPLRLQYAEFRWFLRKLRLTCREFAYQVGRCEETVYNERYAGEYVREAWALLLKNSVGAKRFRVMRKACREELNIPAEPSKRPRKPQTPEKTLF